MQLDKTKKKKLWGLPEMNSWSLTFEQSSSISVHVHRPPAVTLNKTPEEFHISTGLR